MFALPSTTAPASLSRATCTASSAGLHTRHYAKLCDGLGGFIHHTPDRGSCHSPVDGRLAMLRTAEMIRSAGFDVDPDFWPVNGAADCTQSYAGCSDSLVAT
nr:hypothetical protein [Streptomyces sp. b94]